MLSALAHNPALLFVAAAISGAGDCIFWIPYHANFSRVSGKRNAATKISLIDVSIKLAGIVGPLLGALIASHFGANRLFLVAAIFFAAATIPLLLTKDFVRQKKLNYTRVKPRGIAADLLSSGSSGISYLVSSVTWPLFLAIVIVSYTKIGALVSGSMLIGFMLVLIVGRLTDKGFARFFLLSGSVLVAATSVLRLTASIFFASLATLTDNMSQSFIKTPYLALYYHNASNGNRIEYVARMEQFAFIARLSVISLLLAASFVLNTRHLLLMSFVIAGITSLGIPWIKRR
jgi:DHA1 family multidrug resistance protein-like MFS transporter